MQDKSEIPSPHKVYAKIRPILRRFGLLGLARRLFASDFRRMIASRLGLSEFDTSAVVGSNPRWTANKKGYNKRCILDGINLIADLRATIGVGESARAIAVAVEAAFIPLNYVEYPIPGAHRDHPVTFVPRKTPYDHFTLVHLNPPEFSNCINSLPKQLFQGKYVIALWYWELSQFPAKWYWMFNCLNEIWVTSRYMQHSLSQVSPVPVTHIPMPIIVSPTQVTRTTFSLPDDRFIFLFSFNPASSMGRKNPFGVIEAFGRAFGCPKSGPLLVVKMQKSEPRYGKQAETSLREALETVDGRLIIENLTHQDMHNLIQVSDCYVSLHRAEGLGLGMAEAMALGKPVIATGYSGNMDFMTPANSYLVNYTLREIVAADHVHYPMFSMIYPPGQIWAEPDLDHAALLMSAIVSDPANAIKTGQVAAENMRIGHNHMVTSRVIGDRLTLLVDYLNHELDTERYKTASIYGDLTSSH